MTPYCGLKRARPHIRTGTKEKHHTGNTGITFIQFVKEGTMTMPISNTTKQGIIQQATDWTLKADLDKKLQFPIQTSIRPDIVIQSTATKHPYHC